jgi:hypothetical protein
VFFALRDPPKVRSSRSCLTGRETESLQWAVRLRASGTEQHRVTGCVKLRPVRLGHLGGASDGDRPPPRTEDSAGGWRPSGQIPSWLIPIKRPRPQRGLALQLSSTAPRLRTPLFFSPTHRDRLNHLPVALPTGEAGRSSARQAPVPRAGLGLPKLGLAGL